MKEFTEQLSPPEKVDRGFYYIVFLQRNDI